MNMNESAPYHFIRSQMFLPLHNIHYKIILAFFFQINENFLFQAVTGDLYL